MADTFDPSEIIDPKRTAARRMREAEAEAGVSSPAPPPAAAAPNPNAFQFFGGTKAPIPGTGPALESSLSRALRERDAAIKQAQLEEAARALQLQQPRTP